MQKIKTAIVSYGNIGKYVLEALQASSDFEVAGIVRRNASNNPEELAKYKVVDDIKKLDRVEVAILCSPTRQIEAYAKEMLALGINTVDSYDIHSGIVNLRSELDKVARKYGSKAIVSAGWDPGSDSVIRALFEAM